MRAPLGMMKPLLLARRLLERDDERILLELAALARLRFALVRRFDEDFLRTELDFDELEAFDEPADDEPLDELFDDAAALALAAASARLRASSRWRRASAARR